MTQPSSVTPVGPTRTGGKRNATTVIQALGPEYDVSDPESFTIRLTSNDVQEGTAEIDLVCERVEAAVARPSGGKPERTLAPESLLGVRPVATHVDHAKALHCAKMGKTRL